MPRIAHPGGLREPAGARPRRAIRPHHGYPNGRRRVTADTALRLGRYLGNGPQFWLDLQRRYAIAVIAGERGEEIARRVRPADAA